MCNVDEEFPVWGLLPKKETGVVSFLSKYPEYDGRGLVIAVFDSGVDPGAPGLQETSDGKIKMLERFDCSGNGDVTMTTVVQAEDGYLTGLSGRKLKVPKNWKNPSGDYRLGVKNAFDLYPEKLKERIQNEYKEKKWDGPHRLAQAEAIRQLGKFDAKYTSGQTLSEAEKLEKEDLEAKVDLLNNFQKKFIDSGPVYDCILFHDGSKWMCSVDTNMDGDLENAPLIGEYSITHEYFPLTKSDQLNVSMNVHDDGNVLELVGLCSSHGTHVASIAASYFPDNPEKNGIAPGAQIMSFCIGDGRLGSMETGTAVVRAIIKVMELQKQYPIKVINMSYGEQAHWSNTGRIGDLMSEVVNKYGIVWVAAGGNHGPALSTLGTPPDISQDTLIGVGAFVSPDMMVAEYSMRQKLKGMPYTWSSRGPAMDGGIGISICAPGGAITSVPNFTLRHCQLMNGTSMASPHVAGAVAAMLSGLMQKQVNYSPYNVKRAMENTAQFLDDSDKFAQGSGLLQMDRAFEWLLDTQNEPDRDVRFQVTCGSGSGKGIYIRSKLTSKVYEFPVAVEPFFLMPDEVDPAVKISFNMRLVLTCKETFVSYPKHLDVANLVRVFSVRVDIDGLSPGVHSTQIEAFDTDNLRKGPVFKIPVTVIVPQEVVAPGYKIQFKSVTFKPNTIKRHFYVVPEYATLGTLQLRTLEPNTKGRFIVHCMHMLPKQSCTSLEFMKPVYISANADTCLSFQTRPGLVVEIVVAKYWADLGDVQMDYSISFQGIKLNYPVITMHAAEGIHNVEVASLQGEEVLPSMQLKQSVQILKPNESKVNPLTQRDVLPPGRQIYELLLVYNFHLSKGTEVSPNSALLSNVLYESEFESQLWMLFDSNKQLLGCGDAYPSKYSVKLDKGDYTIRMQIRHDKKEYLDKLVEIPLLLNQKLSSPIVLDVYNSHSQAVVGGKKSNTNNSTPFVPLPLYIAPITQEKFNAKLNNTAHYLTGQATFFKDEAAKKADAYTVKYVLYENNKKTSKNNDKDKTKQDEYLEALRDLKAGWLGKLDVRENADKLYEELEKEFGDFLPIHTSYLQSVDAMDVKRQLPILAEQQESLLSNEDVQKVLAICDKVLDSVNQESLLAYFSVKTDLRSDAAKIKSQMERQKNVFLECLCRKGISLCKLTIIKISSGDGTQKSNKLEEITKIYQNLMKFVDPNDGKPNSLYLYYFLSWHAVILKQYGRALKYLMKILEDKPCRELEDKIIEICAVNDWPHLVDHLKRSLPAKYPSAYRPF